MRAGPGACRIRDVAGPRCLASLLLLAAAAGCAINTPAPPAGAGAARCLALFAAVERAVEEDGVSPSSPARVPGFPHLRVDRFLASFAGMPLAGAAARDWVGGMLALGRQARAVELDSLDPATRRALAAAHGTERSLAGALEVCARDLAGMDLASPPRLAVLARRARVPPDYRTGRRVLGLYPLTAVAVIHGIARLHAETRRRFAVPLAELAVTGRLRRYRPPPSGHPPGPRVPVPRDGLGVPRPGPDRLAALFHAHAPVWEIDVAGRHDLPGAPVRQSGGRPDVDTRRAVVYTYPSWTRWHGSSLLQLNYQVWFAARPRRGPLDILGGALDGLVWRVTLDADANPLAYDSIHPCGCYHLLFPGPAVALRPAALALPEPPLAPQAGPLPGAGQRVVIRVASGSHYVQRIYLDEPGGEPHAWAPYEALYRVPVDGGGRSSLFDPAGLVRGSERPERWLLWPMGVPSPGAMRERGRHAIAFVGWRHFDDAHLLGGWLVPVADGDPGGPG